MNVALLANYFMELVAVVITCGVFSHPIFSTASIAAFCYCHYNVREHSSLAIML